MAFQKKRQKGKPRMTPAQKPATVPESASESGETPSLHEQIAALAYSLWQERSCPEGSPDVDWFKAEAELTAPQN